MLAQTFFAVRNAKRLAYARRTLRIHLLKLDLVAVCNELAAFNDHLLLVDLLLFLNFVLKSFELLEDLVHSALMRLLVCVFSFSENLVKAGTLPFVVLVFLEVPIVEFARFLVVLARVVVELRLDLKYEVAEVPTKALRFLRLMLNIAVRVRESKIVQGWRKSTLEMRGSLGLTPSKGGWSHRT